MRDLERTLTFYQDEIGLALIDRDTAGARLGVGHLPLLTLWHRPDASPDDPRSAGLFHTAFLMPTRADLARFVLHIARRRTPISGVADHLVSEAIYLDDPEGNGVEVYCDRPPETWTRTGDQIEITTDPLDVEDLVRAAGDDAAYRGAPAGARIGHVHLRVGDVATAERFYHETIGLDVTRRRHGASFMSSGGYHHHIAANVWRSSGAGPREENRAGLALVTIEAEGAAYDALAARLDAAGIAGIGPRLPRPWGTRIGEEGLNCRNPFLTSAFHNGAEKDDRAEFYVVASGSWNSERFQAKWNAVRAKKTLHPNKLRPFRAQGGPGWNASYLSVRPRAQPSMSASKAKSAPCCGSGRKWSLAKCKACGQWHEWPVRDAWLAIAA